MIKSFQNAIRSRKPLHGLLITVPSPELVEIVSAAGFDWLFIDLEHSTMGYETLQNLLRCVKDSCFTAVRVPEATATHVARVLDAGAEAVIFPKISTVSQARNAISMCKYPPAGSRGVGLGRAQGYGNTFTEYLQVANERVACILQIEDEIGVKNASKIAAVQGVDALFMGPYDLSMDLGIPGNVTHERIEGIIKSLAELKTLDLGLGIFTTDPSQAKKYTDLGYNLIACGIDVQLLNNGARQLLRDVQTSST